MSKRVFIVHGWDGSPKEAMHVWIKSELERKGFEVYVPKMPNTKKPEIDAWISHLKKLVGKANKGDYFIGHSIGCQGILRYLETLDLRVRIGGCVLIAPWMKLDEETIKEEGEEVYEIAKPWVEMPINFAKVKQIGRIFTVIFSDNDPYVPLSNKEIFENELNAKVLIEKNMGHFTESDSVKEVPFVLEEFLKLSKD